MCFTIRNTCWRHCYSIKSLALGLILGGYIYRYTPRRYAPDASRRLQFHENEMTVTHTLATDAGDAFCIPACIEERSTQLAETLRVFWPTTTTIAGIVLSGCVGVRASSAVVFSSCLAVTAAGGRYSAAFCCAAATTSWLSMQVPAAAMATSTSLGERHSSAFQRDVISTPTHIPSGGSRPSGPSVRPASQCRRRQQRHWRLDRLSSADAEWDWSRDDWRLTRVQRRVTVRGRVLLSRYLFTRHSDLMYVQRLWRRQLHRSLLITANASDVVTVTSCRQVCG